MENELTLLFKAQFKALFKELWQDYTQRLCPSAQRIHTLFEQDAPIINDHIALRTFALPNLGLSNLATPFERLGYKAKEEYFFKKKHLYARHYEHSNPLFPKVFISELCLEACSDKLKKTITKLTADASFQKVSLEGFQMGRPWELDWALYQALLAESEYAAWVAAHGFGANHFTVNVNQLLKYDALEKVNGVLKAKGFELNRAGGEIKGGKAVYLAQSSTMADNVPVAFSDGTHLISGGFYEFALRYPLPSGDLFQGFVADSADKIFESTHHKG